MVSVIMSLLLSLLPSSVFFNQNLTERVMFSMNDQNRFSNHHHGMSRYSRSTGRSSLFLSSTIPLNMVHMMTSRRNTSSRSIMSSSSSLLYIISVLKSFVVLLPAMNIHVPPNTRTVSRFHTLPHRPRFDTVAHRVNEQARLPRQQYLSTRFFSISPTTLKEKWRENDDANDALSHVPTTTESGIKVTDRIDDTPILTNDCHNDSIVRSRTNQWVRQIVIGLNLCPFALQPFQNQQIKIVVVRDDCRGNRGSGDVKNDVDDEPKSYNDRIIQQVQNEIELLVQSTETGSIQKRKNEPTTTLIVCPECYPDDFLSYLNIVHDIEDMIEDNDSYNGIVQLASFHPQYCFDGSLSNTDPDNCTNQSPYPTFHLLREVDVSHVVDTALPHQDSSIVWSRNVDLLRTLHEELSESEFTSVMTIPEPPAQLVSHQESDSDMQNSSDSAVPAQQPSRNVVQRNPGLIFRVRQILRRFPISLLRNHDDQ